MTTTRDLIDAIQAGDAVAVESTFNDLMMAKAADRLEDIRQQVAANMFGESTESLHAMALHVSPVGQNKYRVHKVGSKLAQAQGMDGGIKVGEHLTDSELDDMHEMGARIKHIKHVKEEVEELDDEYYDDDRDGMFSEGRAWSDEEKANRAEYRQKYAAEIAKDHADRMANNKRVFGTAHPKVDKSGTKDFEFKHGESQEDTGTRLKAHGYTRQHKYEGGGHSDHVAGGVARHAGVPMHTDHVWRHPKTKKWVTVPATKSDSTK